MELENPKYIEIRIREIEVGHSSGIRDILKAYIDEGGKLEYFTGYTVWFDADKIQTVVKIYTTDKFPDDYLPKELFLF